MTEDDIFENGSRHAQHRHHLKQPIKLLIHHSLLMLQNKKHKYCIHVPGYLRAAQSLVVNTGLNILFVFKVIFKSASNIKNACIYRTLSYLEYFTGVHQGWRCEDNFAESVQANRTMTTSPSLKSQGYDVTSHGQ